MNTEATMLQKYSTCLKVLKLKYFPVLFTFILKCGEAACPSQVINAVISIRGKLADRPCSSGPWVFGHSQASATTLWGRGPQGWPQKHCCYDFRATKSSNILPWHDIMCEDDIGKKKLVRGIFNREKSSDTTNSFGIFIHNSSQSLKKTMSKWPICGWNASLMREIISQMVWSCQNGHSNWNNYFL